MELNTFIHDLVSEGKVKVHDHIQPFSEKDLKKCELLLKKMYDQDKINHPLSQPMFSANAAIWAASFIYRAAQFIMLRSAENEEVQSQLALFREEIGANEIYSADLTLRYLPQIYQLAKGLSPEDVLVKCLNEVAVQFPYSSVGIELNQEADHEAILNHPSLRLVYLDRIIQAKHLHRVKQNHLAEKVKEVLGDHLNTFWPALSDIIN